MDVKLVEERILVLPDHFDLVAAEMRAGPRRLDAFGTLAKMSGLLAKPKLGDIELVYKERRLQPFWSLRCTAICAYERTRTHHLKLPAEVRQIAIGGQTSEVQSRSASIPVLETCREEFHKEAVFDARSGQPATELTQSAKTGARLISPEALAALGVEHTVLLPPQAKAAVVIRDLVASLNPRIEADRLIEETVVFETIDLCYRPIYAFRYRRQGKEAVVEVDGVTGEVKLGGSTFEAYLGKMLEPRFLIDVGAETFNLFIPGATLVKVLVVKGMDLRDRR